MDGSNLQREWLCVSFVVENHSFCVKIWQSSLCLLVCANRMLICSETPPCWLNIRFLVYASVFFERSCTRFFQRPFVQAFTAEIYFICALIEATITFFSAQTNHFSATKVFLKHTRFLFIVFDVSLATLLVDLAENFLLQYFFRIVFRVSLNSTIKQPSRELCASAK